NNAILQHYFNFQEQQGLFIPADTSKAEFKEWHATHLKIVELGFREMPREMYLEWLHEMEIEKEKQRKLNLN
ncbi:MAG: hypothetical protein LIO77_01490, partial [Rikenellaceae bacterium]|nr:hypothetical protein [Rikenellaceae bacterium]